MLLKSMNTSVSNVFNFVANHIFVCGQLIIDKYFYKQYFYIYLHLFTFILQTIFLQKY